MEHLDLVGNLEIVILHALTKKVDCNLSELTHHIVRDAGEWLSFIHRDDANNVSYCLQPYLENITQFDAIPRIQSDWSGQPSLPSSEVLQTMWVYSGNRSNVINCSSLYGENDCKTGRKCVTE